MATNTLLSVTEIELLDCTCCIARKRDEPSVCRIIVIRLFSHIWPPDRGTVPPVKRPTCAAEKLLYYPAYPGTNPKKWK
ncbi:hypothetical protein WH47_06167 [Habropoda laboriosa]|uniref:Uncharacterized protein n=1 Tax=Habropoda laboriosa TaxID=597456 RepID=A0A0L7QTD6_9HYME|nr:hypothetical protein WH47_06167 [Habropoda laboriosa]